MELVEIRDLDGPNVFMLEPAIKIEFAGEPDGAAIERIDRAIERLSSSVDGPAVTDDAWSGVEALIAALHAAAGVPPPRIRSGPLEEPDHHVVAFSWERRRFAKALARAAAEIALGKEIDLDSAIDRLRELREELDEGDDHPLEVLDRDRTLPVIAITGTNGKTTTTRLVSSILRGTGRHVGWTSSVGVFIDDQQVLEGDYTGPAGAHRVFEEEDLDAGVLETARGGMLLRGLGYESNDVGVVTNISADHLGLQGVFSVEGLARVKDLVVRVTKADGYAVLNADDPLVLGMTAHVRAHPFLISRRDDNPAVIAHLNAGGWALFVRDGEAIWAHDGIEERLLRLSEVPITFSGRAGHMVENALCAAAACLGFGLAPDQVRDGLRLFRNRADQNRGRLNVYDVDGFTVIVDYAHNEAGLRHLLGLARSFLNGSGRVIALVGTAGDRDDNSLRGLGRLAGESADVTIIKDSTRYLRGRQTGDIPRLIAEGYHEAGRQGGDDAEPSELAAFHRATGIACQGDVIAMMCVEDYDEILAWLDERGKALS
jgi:cyanophycin synthetase